MAASSVSEDTDSRSPMRAAVPISDCRPYGSPFAHMMAGVRPTPFLLEVMRRLGPNAFTLVAWAEQATATEYASLAPIALSYAEAGDPFAEEIVAEGARHVDVLIRSLVEFGAPRISLLGGLAARLVQWLSPDVLHFLSPPEGA